MKGRVKSATEFVGRTKPEDPEESAEEGKKPSQREIATYKEQKKLADGINQRGRSLAQLKRSDKPILLLPQECGKEGKDEESDSEKLARIDETRKESKERSTESEAVEKVDCVCKNR